jgi:hypothetical protein
LEEEPEDGLGGSGDGGAVLLAVQRSVHYGTGKTVRLGDCRFTFSTGGKVTKLVQANRVINTPEIIVLGSSGGVGVATLTALSAAGE